MTINKKDVEFVGTWEFEEKVVAEKEYKATHKFKSADKIKELPQEVKDLLPGEKANLKDGSKVTPTEPTKKEVRRKDYR